jgi:hypothetical protein
MEWSSFMAPFIKLLKKEEVFEWIEKNLIGQKNVMQLGGKKKPVHSSTHSI